MRRLLLSVLPLAAAAIVLIPNTAHAQVGNISGVARDASDAVLPGVTVEVTSPALIEKVRTTQTDGSPHVVPVDGMWLDGAVWFAGHPSTKHTRNLRANPAAVLHLEDGQAAVIVHGVAAVHVPDDDGAQQLADTAVAKYGYGQPASTYREGVWRLAPVKVLAWNDLPRDATRFRFNGEGTARPT